MKKILTLLMAAGTFATLHAQTREETRRVILGERKDTDGNEERNNRDVVYGRTSNDNYPGKYSSNTSYEIDQINREYDSKINSIRNNQYLNQAEKERTIRQLERDRQQRLAKLNRYDNDRYDRKTRNNRKDKGKHKGWDKKDKNRSWKNKN